MVGNRDAHDGRLARLNRALWTAVPRISSADKRARVLNKAKHSLEAPCRLRPKRAGWFGRWARAGHQRRRQRRRSLGRRRQQAR